MDLDKLKESMPYQWRVQEVKEYGANCVAYIDSRDVQDRLDSVVGAGNWQSDYKEVKGNIYGGIGIKVSDEWVWKWDCGTESNVEKEKGEASDSFKRAAVKWGIGRFLYDLKVVKLKTIKYEKNGKFYPLNETTGNPIFDGHDLTNYINSLIKLKAVSSQPSNYNHTTLGTQEKPLISNMQFKQLCERIRTDDAIAYDKAIKAFTFDSTQKGLIDDLQRELQTRLKLVKV